ncbi:MAG: fumarylacetoacetate hydrolase family protein [Bryobacteraceae bacterium]|nr:fumarylacetoacetate hydrolase family protein [Bryobacteraceae bacterium]
MTRHIRFTLDRESPATVTDADSNVGYGMFEEDAILETEGLAGIRTGRTLRLPEVRLLPPCYPSKIVCVGRNYVDHAKELGNPVPEEPIFFLKPPSSLAADGDPIVFPALSELLSYEGELAAVVGRRARNIRPEEAEEIVFGYTCLNDVTARDLQKRDGQWTRGKGFDTFCPVGPWIVPRAGVDLAALRVQTWVDGEKKQDAPVGDMIFPLDAIVAYVTRFMTLEPGDLIATGTPPGVGPMRPGSEVSIVIEGIGTLRNRIVEER